jgi:excisionase family DNA binding protein
MPKNYRDTPGAQQSAHAQTWGKLLTLKQAADYTICTPRYLQKQIRAGRLRALKPTGKLVRIRQADLAAFLESGATIGGPE